mmetsp:Transcript_2360/g.5343  ORF Transcript_2360/g.5343 Transcript_2360/m.5343 type:complete len:111 (-) Transcript_2360:209-541(-)
MKNPRHTHPTSAKHHRRHGKNCTGMAVENDPWRQASHANANFFWLNDPPKEGVVGLVAIVDSVWALEGLEALETPARVEADAECPKDCDASRSGATYCGNSVRTSGRSYC